MSAFWMVSLFADQFNDSCPLAHQQFVQHPWWDNQRGWKNLLNNLRLIIQPFICSNWLKQWLKVFPIASLHVGFEQLTHRMNAFICPLVHQLNRQRIFSSAQSDQRGLNFRDIGRYPVPPIDEAWIAAAFTPPDPLNPSLKSALNISDELIDELFAANLLVFGIPMYNYSVPANFKAYIDQIVRVRQTFAIDSDGYKGLVNGKRAVVYTRRQLCRQSSRLSRTLSASRI